jgi:hypothetical protein
MSIMQWEYRLAIRAKNSAGTVLATYYAGQLQNTQGTGDVMIAPTRIGPPTYEKVQLDREGYDYTRMPVVRGFRPHLTVSWEQRNPGIRGLPWGGLVDLAPVLAFVTTVGNYLEVSLNGGLDGSWRSCNLESSSIDYKTIDGKAVGVALELAFEGRRLISSVPDLAPQSWGTAT